MLIFYTMILINIFGMISSNDSELVELWNTIRNDRQKHIDMLKDDLKKKFSTRLYIAIQLYFYLYNS